MVVINRHVAASLMIAGLLIGVLGFLYLTYDLFGRRQKWLQRFLWHYSSGLVVATILVVFYLLLLMVIGLPYQASLADLVRLGWFICLFAIMMQILFQGLYSLVVVRPQDPPLFIWQNTWLPAIMAGLFYSVFGAFFASVLWGIAFASVGAVISGGLAGLSEGIQWRVNYLPQNRLATIGVLLLVFGSVLVLVYPLAILF